MRNKIFILGGRSGTSLMLKILIKSGLRNYHEKPKEPEDLRRIIRSNYPNVPIRMFNSGRKDWQVTKLPDYDFVIDKIIKRFKNPLFILMDRNVHDTVSSYIGVGWEDAIKDILDENHNLMKEMVKVFRRKPENRIDSLWMWETWMRLLRKKHLKGYNKKNIFYLNFNYWMMNFDKVMKGLAKFLNIQPRLQFWRKLREIKASASNYGVMNYIRDEENAKR